MLQLSDYLKNRAVLSLRAGEAVATVSRPIINPNNLKIEGFYCHDRFENKELILLTQDIREVLKDGFVIDDHEKLAEAKELVRLESVLELKFDLIGKQVETVDKEKVGKVTEKQVADIAKQKMPDLNAASLEAAIKSVKGTARSMGIDVTE